MALFASIFKSYEYLHNRSLQHYLQFNRKLVSRLHFTGSSGSFVQIGIMNFSASTWRRLSVCTLRKDNSLRRSLAITDRSLCYVNLGLLRDCSPLQFVAIKKYKSWMGTWTPRNEPWSFSQPTVLECFLWKPSFFANKRNCSSSSGKSSDRPDLSIAWSHHCFGESVPRSAITELWADFAVSSLNKL